jgi:ferric-dicitrate binding protein FerR (iron transport regulator)
VIERSALEPASEHAPKLRALRAFERLQLTAAGATRLQGHLAGCEVCRRALTGLRLANQLIGEAQAAPVDCDVSRIEAGLARSQQRDGRRRAVRVALGVPLAAAAAAGVFWLATGHSGLPSEAVSPAVPPQLARTPARDTKPSRAVFAASVTALAGPGTLQRAAGVEEPLRIDASLREGDVVRLLGDSLAHIRVDRASGCVLGPGSELALLRLRTGETEVELRSGRLTSQVQQLSAAEHFLVRAAGYQVTVHGTHFEVVASNDALSVMVAEGHVMVRDDTGRVIADLHARDHFAVDAAFGMRLATRDPSHRALQLEQPRALGIALEEWPLVTLLDVEALESLGLTGFAIDGTRFPVSGELALRVPRGDVTLIVERLTVAPQKIVLHVPADGLSLAPDALRKLLRQQRPEAGTRGADIDFQPMLAVVHAGTENLQRCYERALKQRPDLDGRLTMRLAVSPDGRVREAQPRGQSTELPEVLVACLRTVSGQWRFPATGSALTFDIPLRLSPR